MYCVVKYLRSFRVDIFASFTVPLPILIVKPAEYTALKTFLNCCSCVVHSKRKRNLYILNLLYVSITFVKVIHETKKNHLNSKRNNERVYVVKSCLLQGSW